MGVTPGGGHLRRRGIRLAFLRRPRLGCLRGGLPLIPLVLILLPLVAVPVMMFGLSVTEAADLSAYPWVYLRDGEPVTGGEDAVTVVVVGDVMVGRGVADEPDPLRDVAPVLEAADVVMGNLECVLAAHVEGPHAGIGGAADALTAPSSAAPYLRQAGFDLLGLANNHALDRGSSGLAETVAWLQAAGIDVVGVGPDLDGAYQAVVREVGEVRVAFLAFNGVIDGRRGRPEDWTPADWSPESAAAVVRSMSTHTDAIIVSVHWGYEYQTEVDPAQRAAAQHLLEAGADLVVGHHPHVVQPFERAPEGCVAYSVGNFAFDQTQGKTGEGLALRATFDHEGLRGVQALPLRSGPRPRLVDPEEASELMTRLVTPERVRFACSSSACYRVGSGAADPNAAGATVFWGGRIDLTGDGVAEHVRRVKSRVVVYDDTGALWETPPAWRVVDLALGDPNQDGRAEMLLALWKTGLDGLETPSPEKLDLERSHPFIVGYRGGRYRTLWGGSAVRDPIREVELGDVDGDSDQELVVLEGAGVGKRAISVWRWHGWGFSLVWRSDEGAYRDLSVAEDGVISVVSEDGS